MQIIGAGISVESTCSRAAAMLKILSVIEIVHILLPLLEWITRQICVTWRKQRTRQTGIVSVAISRHVVKRRYRRLVYCLKTKMMLMPPICPWKWDD